MIRCGAERDGVAGVEQTDYNPSDAKVSLTELLPREIPTFVTHPIVRKKMALLRGEFFWLLDKMGKSGNPLVRLTSNVFATQLD